MRSAFIGRGMRMEFRHPEHQTVTTSPVVENQETRRPAKLQPRVAVTIRTVLPLVQGIRPEAKVLGFNEVIAGCQLWSHRSRF